MYRFISHFHSSTYSKFEPIKVNPCYDKCHNPVHGILSNCSITGNFPFEGKCECPAGFEGENCKIRKSKFYQNDYAAGTVILLPVK